ncbi:hypothetical protein HPB49_022375 [Dermacentor silvarum]|uniref:Uncharacterized protein n=1 Tax=Dermacentor silvarum TaxID=543639 RepID=A0ACB8CN06_DERSI|nr:hypothetical protein HPB49_022375 [Dermacentor silvarum]
MMDCEVEGEILTPEDFTKDSGWQLVAARRSTRRRNAAANQTRAEVVEVQPNAGSNARCRPDHAGIKSKIIRGGRMPPLPKEEAKIIVRPRGGLCISKVGPTAVADAIWQAAGLDSATRDTDTMCPNFQQNIMVISTPNRNNAARYVGRDPGLVDAPGAAPSPGPGRDPGSDTNLGPDPVPGAAKVPEPSHHPDLSPPPQAAGDNRPSFGPIWAVVNQTCESGVLSAEVSEIKQTLTALADSLKQVAPSVTFLTDSVRQIQVALRDPKRGLGALADRIDAIEA